MKRGGSGKEISRHLQTGQHRFLSETDGEKFKLPNVSRCLSRSSMLAEKLHHIDN
ncbi:hypothetical protein [Parageobacillus thermoglucosidasius]|uniref:hypothetical protein n=1 Tax=Parageobacillus thermoglucosidasius TaxID=1426 RepID=UPI00192A1FF7|nr:hypothetical protein [Parageobacillus thermoglucosidasius]